MKRATIRVFVSSTWLDLQPERKAVEAALQRLRETRHVGMEYFGSREKSPRDVSLAEVDRSQVYVGIIGGRYGSGITEAEYRRAWRRKLQCFLYLKAEKTIGSKGREKDAKSAAKLARFKAALQVSYDLLAEDQRRRWTVLAVFAASFDLRAAAAVWGEEEEAARAAMQGLVNGSLVGWNEANGRFRLHDLVRPFCDGKLAEGERTPARLRHAEHYVEVGAEADALYLAGGEEVVRGLALFDRERAQLEGAFAWLRERRDQASAELLVRLVGAVAYTGDLRFHPRQRIGWLEGQRDAARLTGDRRGEGAALGNLGLAYAVLGDARKAIEYHERHRDLAREIGDRRGEGNALWDSALALDSLGDRRKAIARAEAALQLYEAIEHPNAPQVRAQLEEWRAGSRSRPRARRR